MALCDTCQTLRGHHSAGGSLERAFGWWLERSQEEEGGGKACLLICKHDPFTPTREIKRHVKALARNHPEGWKVQGYVSPATTKCLSYRIGLDDGAAGTRGHQSCPLHLSVREVARCHGTLLPYCHATIPVLASEARDSPTDAGQYQDCERRSPPAVADRPTSGCPIPPLDPHTEGVEGV